MFNSRQHLIGLFGNLGYRAIEQQKDPPRTLENAELVRALSRAHNVLSRFADDGECNGNFMAKQA